jgi:hypothetical protein
MILNSDQLHTATHRQLHIIAYTSVVAVTHLITQSISLACMDGKRDFEANVLI